MTDERERELEADPRAGEIGTGAFRGPYYNYVGRVGPYPQGPTTKGIHTTPEADAPASELAVDDQTANPAPTTEMLLQTPPPAPREGEPGDYEPLNPELEPEPSEPGVPIITEQPAFAYGDPGTGLENIHTEPPEGEGGPEPEIPELVISAPADGATVPAVHDVTGSGALPDSTVELWHLISATQVADTQVATTTADSSGNWAFAGDTPTVPGECIWQVRQDGYSSASVTVTVEAAARAGEDDWQGLHRHNDLDDFLKSRSDLTRPEEWDGLTIADKKSWLDRNARR